MPIDDGVTNNECADGFELHCGQRCFKVLDRVNTRREVKSELENQKFTQQGEESGALKMCES